MYSNRQRDRVEDADSVGSNPSMDMPRYTREQLAQAAASSVSVAATCRALGIQRPGGSTQTNIRNRLQREGIDTSHFLGQAHNRDRPSRNRRPWREVLVKSTSLNRERASALRRALVESGRAYRCTRCCNDGQWQQQPLLLEVHHLNGDWMDNRSENLQLVCPNCHQQLDRA